MIFYKVNVSKILNNQKKLKEDYYFEISVRLFVE